MKYIDINLFMMHNIIISAFSDSIEDMEYFFTEFVVASVS